MDGTIVVCHNLLSGGIYTTLVYLVFGTAIPTSFSILFTLVSLVFHCITKCNLAIACYSPTLFQLQPALSMTMYAIKVFTRALTGSLLSQL